MSQRLIEVVSTFFKLGCIAFGGPAAHIAMMEDEIIKKRQWMTHEHFLDLIGATNLVPGPNSTEMTMHCGYERAGWKGLIAAGVCFIFPAVTITMVFAWAYTTYGQLPNVQPFIYGIKPAVIAIILAAVYKLGKKAIKKWELGALATLTFVACLLGVNEINALFGCGLIGLFWFWIKNSQQQANSFSSLIVLKISISSFSVFLSFLKVGAILYGSGYVLFAFLDAELVSKGLLTKQELIDAVAVGQFTPGPVLSTATFIGWQLNGFWGALAATFGIFLPSFIFVALLNPLLHKIRKSPVLSAFLDAVNAAAVAVILAVCVEMGKATFTNWKTILIAFLGVVVVFGLKKINSMWLVIGGSLLGYGLSFIG